MLFLLVKLSNEWFPEGWMTWRYEFEVKAEQFKKGSRYVMPDGTEGVVVERFGERGHDGGNPVYNLLKEISEMTLPAEGDAAGVNAMEVLGGLLSIVHAHTEETERNKWTEEKAELLKAYNETGERLAKNLSRCVDVIRGLRAKNEKLHRKHMRATVWVQMFVELLHGIDEDVIAKRIVEMEIEGWFEPAPANPNPQPATPATTEGESVSPAKDPPAPDPKTVEPEK